MRSRKSGVGSPTNGVQDEEEEENAPSSRKRKLDRESDASGTAKKPQKPPGNSTPRSAPHHLSKEDMLKLLGVMEGEVQAREYIIQLLKGERVRPEALEAHYGSAAPIRPLQALQRDSLLTNSQSIGTDVYQTPMVELDRLEQRHREAYRRMLEQLLLAEKCHRRTVHELDHQKHKHTDYMHQSDEFTGLLEQERERLKKLLEQEKAYQARKENDHRQRLEKVRDELVKLKSFALMLVDERQLHLEQIDQQSQRVQDLNRKLQEKEQALTAAGGKAKEDGQRILKLEAELEHKAARFVQEHEGVVAKLANQESQNRQLRLKLATLTRHIEELEDANKLLQRSEEELRELRDKISKGECGNSSLVAELENLRKRVLEMEGKDEEITKTESRCKELMQRLQDKESHARELKLEVEKLQKRMMELEKLEGAFSASRSECTQLHANVEREKSQTKKHAAELEMVKNRVKELESQEAKLEKTETGLKDDLKKLKSFTVMLVNERKNMAETIQREEKKSEEFNKMFKAEQAKVTEITEKLIEESKTLLKLKSEMEAKATALATEKDELKAKLASEEEKCKDLSSKANLMKERLEEAEREWSRGRVRIELGRLPDQDNKVKELTLEIEKLKNRLRQLEVVEGDLIKTEDEYDSLEKKFRTEQDKANVLSRLLEEMNSQIARNKAIEKGEVLSQEAEIRRRWKVEEAKSRDLQADVQALTEKIHQLMNKEDQLSQLQVDYCVLQQRFAEEENKNKDMRQEVLNLTKELEVAKRYGRALRPSMNGRRIVDVPLASTGVQTDMAVSESAEEDTPAVFIRKSVQEEHHIMSNLRQKGLRKPAVLERYPPAANELNMRKSWIPWMKKKDTVVQSGPEKANHVNEVSPSEVTMSQKPGQPLHIRVTPDHENSTATLEITRPRAEDFFSSATIIPTLGLQKPRITIFPKPTTVTQKGGPTEGAASRSPERAKSPVTITTISRARCPERGSGDGTPFSDSPLSPVSIITVSTSPVPDRPRSPELRETAAARAVLRVTPEKQVGPASVRKFSNSNIITTEDNKIHIHLGPQFKRPPEASYGRGPGAASPKPPPGQRENVATGTVLRSPRHGKVMSSISITPITSAVSRPTQSVAGQDVQPARSSATRIPMSKGMKTGKNALGSPGVSAATKLESLAEGQPMKIELRKSMLTGGSTPPGGGKG